VIALAPAPAGADELPPGSAETVRCNTTITAGDGDGDPLTGVPKYDASTGTQAGHTGFQVNFSCTLPPAWQADRWALGFHGANGGTIYPCPGAGWSDPGALCTERTANGGTVSGEFYTLAGGIIRGWYFNHNGLTGGADYTWTTTTSQTCAFVTFAGTTPTGAVFRGCTVTDVRVPAIEGGSADPDDVDDFYPGGEDPDDPAEGCQFTSLHVYNTITGDEITDDVAADEDWIWQVGITYRFVAYFTGTLQQVQIIYGDVAGPGDVTQDTRYAPIGSPVSFDHTWRAQGLGLVVVSGRTGDVSATGVPQVCAINTGTPSEGFVPTTGDPGRPGVGQCASEVTNGLSLLSPTSWIRSLVRGVGCLLSWAFVPTQAELNVLSARVNAAYGNSGVSVVTDAGGQVAEAWTAFGAGAGSGGCAGPDVEFSMGGEDVSMNPLTTCSGTAGATFAPIIKTGLSALAVIGGVWALIGSISGAFGVREVDPIPNYMSGDQGTLGL
jgi:hypothetical protein